MKSGDTIRVFTWRMGNHVGQPEDFIVEEFRYCLGIFMSDEDRQACKFTPLCDLYEKGPELKRRYIANYGEYYTNQVQAWMDI